MLLEDIEKVVGVQVRAIIECQRDRSWDVAMPDDTPWDLLLNTHLARWEKGKEVMVAW